MADGRHHIRETRTQKVLAAIKKRWHYLAAGGILVAAIVTAVWASYAVEPRVPAPAVAAATTTAPPSPTTVAAAPTTQAVTVSTDSEAERVYLNELAEAGLQLTPREQVEAIEIAREHISHGHLVGMRELIRKDFRERIPRLNKDEVEIAKVALEHHFLAVTGRKQ